MRIKYLIATHHQWNFGKKTNFSPPTSRQYSAWTKTLEFHPTTPALKALAFTDKDGLFRKNCSADVGKLLDSLPHEFKKTEKGMCYNITEDFVRVEIKDREYYSLADELIRLSIKPENVVCLNDELFEETENGYDWKTKVSVITFDNVKDTLKFIWFNKMMLNPNSVHYKMSFCECYESAGMIVEGKTNTVEYCPPSVNQIIRIWTMLRYGFNCPPHLHCLLKARDLNEVNTRVQKIRAEHVKLFDDKRGGSDFGIVPPLTGSFTADDMEDSAVMAFNRFSKLNEEFKATDTQSTRFKANHHSMLLNNFGLSWSGSNNRKTDLPTLSSAFLADKCQPYTKDHDESISHCRSLKFRNQFVYSKNPEGQLKLSRKLFEFYSKLFGVKADIDEDTENRITSNVHQSIQQKVVPIMKAEILPLVDTKIQDQMNCNLASRILPMVTDQCRGVISNDLENIVMKALPGLIQREIQVQLKDITPPNQADLEKLKADAIAEANQAAENSIAARTSHLDNSITALQAQVGTNKNEIKYNNLNIGLNKERACLNTSLAISICPKIQDALPDVRTMAVPFHVLEEKLPELTKQDIKLQKIRQRLNGGAGFAESIHNASLNASSSMSINTDDIVTDDIPVLEFKKPGEDYEEMEFQECHTALEDEVVNQSVVTNDYNHLIDNRNQSEYSQVAEVSYRNDSELSVGTNESNFDSRDHSFASRDSFAAPNLPFNRPINKNVNFNIAEKRNAFHRKYAYELKLSPILFNRLHYIILIHNIEFVQILRQLSTAKVKYPIMQGLKEEATLILAEIVNFDWSPDKVHAVVYGVDKIELPKITVHMMHHVIEVFELCDINIPYIRAAELKPMLKLLFKMTTLNFENYVSQAQKRKQATNRINFSRTRCTCKHHPNVERDELQVEQLKRSINNVIPPAQKTFSTPTKKSIDLKQNAFFTVRPLTHTQSDNLVINSDDSLESVLELARTDTQIIPDSSIPIMHSNAISSSSDPHLPTSEPNENLSPKLTKNTPESVTLPSHPKVFPPESQPVIQVYDPSNRYNLDYLIETELADSTNEALGGIPPEAFLLPPNTRPKYVKDNFFDNYLKNKKVPSIHDPFIMDFLPESLKVKAHNNLKRDLTVVRTAIKNGKIIQNKNRAVKPSLEIGYMNLHKPLKQIPFIMQQSHFGQLDILVLNELMLDPIYFENQTLTPKGYDVYYHKPVEIKVYKGFQRRIFSAILVKRSHGLIVKQMPAPAPFTSIFCKVKQIDDKIQKLNILTCYRTHFEAYNNNLGLKIYGSKDTPETKRLKHNHFYQNNFMTLVRRYQSKCAGIIVGDFNMDIYKPRPQDSKSLAAQIRELLTVYDQHVKSPTNHTHSRHKGRAVLTHSMIDFFFTKNLSGKFFHHMGELIESDGHDVLTFKTSLRMDPEPKYFTVETVSRPDRVTMYRTAQKYLDLHRNDLDLAYQQTLDSIDPNEDLLNKPRTNLFTKKFIELLELAVSECTEKRYVKVPLGPRLSSESPYTKMLRKELHEWKVKLLNRRPSDLELSVYTIIRKLLRMSNRLDYSQNLTDCPVESEMTKNEVFEMTRKLNPKDKASFGKCGDHSPDDLLQYFIDLQTRDTLPVDPNFNGWKEADVKLNLSFFQAGWFGDNVANSLQKCLRQCKPHQMGKNSRLTATILGMFPIEYSKYIVMMHECNIKSGMAPEIVRETRLSQLPKLSHADLSALGARRFLSLAHVLASMEGKCAAKILSDFLEQFEIIPESQHGFRPNKSCSTMLATLFSYLNSLKKSDNVFLILVDGKNAFGSISPAQMDNALGKIMEGEVLSYFRSVFLEKTVHVVDKGKKSKTHTFSRHTHGVPQGYNSSPHFYTIASLIVANLFKDHPFIKILCFADDISLVIHHENFATAEKLAREALLEVEKHLADIGVAVNMSKTELMVLYQKHKTYNGKFFVDQNRSIPEKLEVKLLGLRFDSFLSIKNQYDFVLNDRFHRHRGLLNCVLLANSRINLIGFVNSTYYGNMQYAMEVMPNISNSDGNKYAFAISLAICDIYGLPCHIEQNMRHSYRQLFSKAGLQSPFHTQNKLILCFANRMLSARSETDELRLATEKVLRVRTKTGALLKFNLMDPYSFQRLMSINLLSLEIYQPRTQNKFYPHNLALPFKLLSNVVKTEICTPAFNRMVKIYFKYKCPHRQGKNGNQCVQCVEIDKSKHHSKRIVMDAIIKHTDCAFSLLHVMAIEGTGEWLNDFVSYRKLLQDRLFLLLREIIKGNIKL